MPCKVFKFNFIYNYILIKKNKMIKKALFFFSLILIANSSLLAQAPKQSNIISGISVSGNVFADEQTIIAISGIKVGSELNPNKLQSAIKALWNRKQFSDIDIITEKNTPGGVFLLIKVKEFQRLNQILPKNNDKLDYKDIQKAVGKQRGDILSPYDAYLAKIALKKEYEKEGMMFAKIETDFAKTDTAEYVNLILNIEEGVTFYVKQINIDGCVKLDSKDVASAMDDTKTKHWWQFWKSTKFDAKKFEEDKKKIVNYLHSNGHYDGELLKDSVIYNEADESVVINMKIFEGEKRYLRDIKFQGNTVYTDEVLRKSLDFKKGDPYDLERFTRNLNGSNEEGYGVASLYLDNGYLQVNVNKEEQKIGADSVDVVVRIFENERMTIRRVEIIGNTKTKDKVIRRELYTRPNDYFNRAAIIRSIRALGVLNYFNQEKIKPDVKPVDKTKVDIVYNVEERSTDTFNAQIGLAGTYGLTASLGFTFNNFSLSDPLGGGDGQIFNFNYESGFGNMQNINIGFTEPWIFDEPTTVGFNLFDSKINYYYEQRRTGASVNIGRRFRFPDDYFRGDWIVRYQQNDIGASGGYYKKGKSSELSLTQAISRTSVDNVMFPTVGSKFAFTTQFALGGIGISTTDYLKNEITYDVYNPLLQIDGNNRVVLYLGSQVGYIAGLKANNSIPPIELYYMGGNGLGGYSVTPLRGYPDPTSNVDDETSGRFLTRYVAELRLGVTMSPMPIYVLGFAEAGNVWKSIKGSDPFRLKRSAGFGLRMMMMPFGLIGFDYGYGFDPAYTSDKVKSGWNFHFQFGR